LEWWNAGILEKWVLASGPKSLWLGEDTAILVNSKIRLNDKVLNGLYSF
jgi:hypothetical protein